MNDWCDEHTDGMIPSIVDRLDPSSKLVMMGAVLLKATWAEKFDPANTRKGRFKNSRTPVFRLNISELPLNKKETGNTLETRGLTYSYTFLTKPKRSTHGRFALRRTLILGAKVQNSFHITKGFHYFLHYCT